MSENCECATWAVVDMAALARGNGHNPACSKYAASEMKLFRINGNDWWMAPTMEEAIAAAMESYGMSRDDVTEEPAQVSDKELCELVFVDDDGSRRSFAEEFVRRQRENPTIHLFASTEF